MWARAERQGININGAPLTRETSRKAGHPGKLTAKAIERAEEMGCQGKKKRTSFGEGGGYPVEISLPQ